MVTTSLFIVIAVGILLLIFTALTRSAPAEPTYVVVVEPHPQRGVGCVVPILFFIVVLIILALVLP